MADGSPADSGTWVTTASRGRKRMRSNRCPRRRCRNSVRRSLFRLFATLYPPSLALSRDLCDDLLGGEGRPAVLVLVKVIELSRPVDPLDQGSLRLDYRQRREPHLFGRAR